MHAEIIAVGTELLLGDVVNSNATWISKELASMGVGVYHHVVVGDNPERIKQVVDQALERSDILIFTGGLGPTDDDLTIATLADLFNEPMLEDPESVEVIRAFFTARDQEMACSNVKQAMRPQSALALKNPIGTAPGVMWDISKKAGKPALLYAFPGVPRELYAMWPEAKDHLKQFLYGSGVSESVINTRFLHFFGIGESKIGELLKDLMTAENPTVAPYVGRAEVRIRVAAKAPTDEKAQALIEPVAEQIIERLKPYWYGKDEDTLEQVVGRLLMMLNKTVSTAESCTGGLVSSRLTDVPGSSAYTSLNAITYSNDQKEKLLGVSSKTLATLGAVSPETAAEMADGIRKVSGSDIGLALTGIAGPTGGTDEKPVGLVYIGLSGLTDAPVVKKVMVNPKNDRVDIKHWFSQYALHYLRQYMSGTLE